MSGLAGSLGYIDCMQASGKTSFDAPPSEIVSELEAAIRAARSVVMTGATDALLAMARDRLDAMRGELTVVEVRNRAISERAKAEVPSGEHFHALGDAFEAMMGQPCPDDVMFHVISQCCDACFTCKCRGRPKLGCIGVGCTVNVVQSQYLRIRAQCPYRVSLGA